MANETPSSRSSAADIEAIAAQLESLREDMKKLASSVTIAAGHRKQALARDISEGMTDAAEYVGRKRSDAEAQLGQAVATNPLRALAVAAGIGLLFGVLWRR